MEGSNSKQVCVEVLKALERAIRCSQYFPRRDELQLIRVTSPGLKEKGNELTKQVLSEIKSVASRYSVSVPSSDSDSCSSLSSGSLSLRDSMFDQTAETTDEALQHFNIALDRARKISNAVVPPQGALGPMKSAPRVGIGYLGRTHGNSLDIEKPQVHFPDYPIDNSDAPFVAPHARDHCSDPSTPYGNMPKKSTQNVETYLQELYKKNSNPDFDQIHPYDNEIASALQEMSAREFKLEQVTMYKSMQATPCAFVSTEEELFNIVERLRTASCIAVDLENHSARSFQGFTCLIQVSTRNEDFVIDALQLRGSIHRALAPIFTDDTIIKVLHGADRDVQWLERDFGIYIVNMFDTGQAARLLKLPSASLAFLLSHFCDISGANKKKFQLADWRQRPLPKEMFKYARSDTHYLLYVFDRLRCELSEKGLLEKAWERSAAVSRKRHRKVRFQPGIAKHLAARHSLGLDKHQIRLLEELCKWRDMTAREEDESLPYVATLKVIFGIVRARDKARTVEGLLKHGFPGGIIPPLVYQNAKKLTELIGDALDARLEVAAEEKGNAEDHTEEHPVRGEHDKNDVAVVIKSRNVTAVGDDGFDGSTLESAAVQKASVTLSNSRSGIHGLTSRCTANANRAKSLAGALTLQVRSTSRSALLDSDSDSDSDSDDDRGCSHVRYANEQSLLEDRKGVGRTQAHELHKRGSHENEESDSIDTRSVVIARSMNKTNESRKGGEGKIESHQTFVRVAAHSVFDLSDNSESEQESTPRESVEKHCIEERIASVRVEIAAEQERQRKPLDFCVDKDEVEKEDNPKNTKIDVNVADEYTIEPEEVISLREGARRAETSRSKKRKRKERLEASQEQPLPLPAFDYEDAIACDEQRKKGKSRSGRFDPMRKLCEEWKPDAKKRVKKRRRGRGQSMSFKAR
ncbi:exosome component 10 Rrp6 [Gracilaria domingensis]|nr:exosome component 10 Rrp6 [Gracilaria domingensis]